MRSLCLTLAVFSCLFVAVGRPMASTSLTGAPVRIDDSQVQIQEAVREDIEALERQIEWAAAKGDAAACDALSPIPLYEGAPSFDEWREECLSHILQTI